MLGKTHVAVGVTAYVAVAGFNPAGMAVVAVASKLPDIDLAFKHRGITHSFIALVVLGFITKAAYPNILTPVLIGYGSHLILDTLTPMGIPWLWPKKTKYKIPIIRTGSIGERMIRYTVMFLLILLAIKEVANM